MADGSWGWYVEICDGEPFFSAEPCADGADFMSLFCYIACIVKWDGSLDVEDEASSFDVCSAVFSDGAVILNDRGAVRA